MRVRSIVFALMATIAAAPAGAVDGASSAVPSRESEVIVFGNDACPRSSDPNEIVVCARRPENERYRIPPAFRERREQLTEQAWGARVAGIEADAALGRPDSCSPFGSWGQTGCTQRMLHDWAEERREASGN